MLEVNGTKVVLTRGDSAYIEVPILESDGATPHHVDEETEAVSLQVRSAKSHTGTLQFDGIIRIQDGVPIWYISPTQSTIEPGTYYWDVQIRDEAGDVNTYNSGTLKITPEVTT